MTATIHGNPIEHGNVDVIKSGGQARHCATGLRYHDLRMCDHRGNAFDGGEEINRNSSNSLNPASFSGALVSGTKRLGSRRPEDGRLRMF